MTLIPRRGFLAGVGGTLALTACGNGVGSDGAQKVDARVDSTLNFLYSRYPNTVPLADKSSGQLVMPLVTKAGLGIGGSYGRGALRVGGATVDYYSATSASAGLQVGAAQYAHVLFFMTDNALERFRRSDGWAVGADVEYVLNENGENLSAETTTVQSPTIAVIFGQAGLGAGATVRGTKYTRIIP